MKILVIGSGGREHCLLWKIAQSDKVKEIFAAPGNGGTESLACNINIAADDIKSLLEFAQQKKIDLTVVGPEVPLVNGIVDEFKKHNLKVFGPEAGLALLEGSKVFAKETMARFSLPTADFRAFTNERAAAEYIEGKGTPCVIKADGLAAGKGVFICNTIEEAHAALKATLVDKNFGDSGKKIIVEECLEGEEASILVFSDGKTIVPLASSQDHKRACDGDSGPNTGGMGAYSPAPLVTDELENQVNNEILKPLIEGLSSEGKKYVGMLYVGIMVTESGPKVLEFNVRFGDPETQAILPRLRSDLVEAMLATISGELDTLKLEWDERPCICVVVASGGYPGSYEKGKEISGLKEAEKLKDTFVFQAGTKKKDNKTFTSSGRVLNVVALGDSLAQAKLRVYEAIDKIKFEKMYFRRDIGWRALNK